MVNTGADVSQDASSASAPGVGTSAAVSGQQAAPKAGPTLPPRPAKKIAFASTSNGHDAASNGPTSAASKEATQQPLQVHIPNPADATASTSKTAPSKRPSSASSGPGTTVSAFMPTLPPRQAAPVSGPVLDPDEPVEIQKVRQRIHNVRVSLIRAAQRLGYDADNGLVRQVLYRLALAEKLKAPWRRNTRRPDPNQVATREAARLEAAEEAARVSSSGTASTSNSAAQGECQPLGFCVKMMLVGLAGTGKSQLVHALLGNAASPPSSRKGEQGKKDNQQSVDDGSVWHAVDPIQGATRKCCVVKGSACGIPLEILDTPGLLAAAAGTSHNSHVLQQIKRAYHSFKPDLVVYVDRLDAGGAARWGGELPALRGLSGALGPTTWLNTIVALTHSGATPPVGARGVPLPWDQWANQRSHVLQQIIRSASGDNRLMNPTAFVESHPAARRDASGAPLLYSGMTWRPHLLLMIVSAKLLSDTENMLQMQDGELGKSGGGAASAAAAQQLLLTQMMGGTPRTLPLPYLISQATQFSQPLKYTDHDQVMAVRRTEVAASTATDPRQKKTLVRQAKALRLQIKQAVQYREKMARSFRMATLAGSKVTPEPPPLASKRPPSAQPPGTFRYRVPEPSGGWVVRPSIEPHGMDTGDGIEGLQMEQYSVVGRGPPRVKTKTANANHQHQAAQTGQTQGPSSVSSSKSTEGADPSSSPSSSSSQSVSTASSSSSSPSLVPSGQKGGPQSASQASTSSRPPDHQKPDENDGAQAVQLGGAPVHHFLSAQATKGQLMLQGRSESTVYHDPLGTTTTSFSGDVQATRTGDAPLDALVSLRADVRRKAVPLLPGGTSNRLTAGVMLTRLAEGGRLDRGPISIGGRLQNTFRSTIGGRRQRPRPGIRLGAPANAPTPAMSMGIPMDVAAAVAVLCAPCGSTSHDTAASLAAVGGGPPASLDPELCLGCNVEVTADMQAALNTRLPCPLTVNANMVSYKGDIMAGLAASLQVRGKRKDACAARIQLSNKGKAGLSLKVRSGPWWWMGLVAMSVPLTSLILEMLGLAN